MNKLYKTLVLLVTILFFSQLTISQHVSYTDNWGNHGFTLEAENSNSVTINYSVTDFYLEDVDIKGEQMKTLRIPGVLLPNDEGAPVLPGSGRYIAIPQGATASFNIVASKTETFKNVIIAPAPRIPLDTDKGPLHYEKDLKIFQRDQFYPKNPVKSQMAKIRGMDVLMLGITPFQYNPVTKELKVYKDLQIEVSYTGGNGQVGDNRLRSRWWDPIIKDAVLNPDAIPNIDYSVKSNPTETPDYEYLIICPDDPVFIVWADSIKNWRNLQGIKTGVVTTTDVGGNTTTAIETYVNDAYNNWDFPPVAVLLLGDYGTSGNTIISPMWNSYCVSDNIYADVDNDDLPDIVFARMTAQNETHLETMITKFLDYERNPPTNPDFYNNPITAMGYQSDRWFQICSETVNGFWEYELGKEPVRENAGYTNGSAPSTWSTNTNTSMVLDYFGPSGLGYIPATPAHLTDWGANATRVNNDINSGAFMLQHRDHGGETGWSEPNYSSSDISGLYNTDLVWVFSINCLTGKYNISGECFTETFHRYTHNGQNSGALGVTAASEISYSFVNDTYVWGLYDNMWPNFMPDETSINPEPRGVLPAFGNAAAKHFLEASSWPYNPQHKVYTDHLFHHHGDAFSTVYTEIPQYLTVTHNAALISGSTSFIVTADNESFIALTVNGEIIGTGEGTGSPVIITIPPQIPGNMMIVTITKQDYYRYSATVDIIPPVGPYVVYQSYNINDNSGNNNGEADFGENILLDMTLENLGSDPAYNVTATLICTDSYITLTDNYESYGTINASSTSTISDAFAFSIANDIPDQHIFDFELQINGNADDLWISYFSITVNAPFLEFGNMAIDDNAGGNGNGRLDPGETADITVPVTNNGHSLSPLAEANLSSLSSWVTINSGYISLGQIVAGNTADAVFNISCDPLTPIGTAVDLTVDVDAGNYDISNTFYQSVGLVLEDWEIGNFFSFPWTFAGTADWTITTVDPYEGTYCAKSGVISHNQTSELVINVETTNDDNISFYRKVSSEGSYDYLQFWIDGTQQEQWSGEAPWAQVSYFVSAGVHTFKWVYTKDGSVSSGSDCGWVDYIIFPSIVPPPDPPDIDMSDLSFEVTVPPGGNTTEILTISNLGEADLDFNLSKYYHPTDGVKAYCVSVGGGGDEFIQNVTIGTINNTTGQSDYADYTAMSTVVNVGESYPITITNGDPIWTSDQCGIWVDWNQNEDFYDDAPVVVTGSPGVGPYTATITPPVDAMPGLVRMRVQIIYAATPDPCVASFTYGEVEDYSLNVNSDFVDWLTIDPMVGTVGDGGSSDIDFTFDATDLDEGDYFVDVTVNSNDPDEPVIIIPCTLHVGGYNVSGYLNYVNGVSTPMDACTVMLYDDADILVGSTTTDALGYYEFTGIADGNYTINMATAKPWGGLSMNDVQVVWQSVTGVIAPLTGLDYLAGDVTWNTILAMDDVQLMRQVVSNNPPGTVFNSPDYIYIIPDFAVSGGDVIQDIPVICSGDVDHSYVPAAGK